MSIRTVDLNLFRVFEAIMRHRSVAGAARELKVTPSAVSHALGRLRQTLNDQLFNATDEGMTPTPRALELAPTVNQGLDRLADAVRSRPFDPLNSTRTFGLAMSDYAATVVLPVLMTRIRRSAPNVNFRIFSLSRRDVIEHMESGQLDMAFGWFAHLPNRMRRLPVAVESEALVVRAGHPLTKQPVTLDRLFAFPHVVVELTGAGDRANDGFLDEQGVERRVWIERLLLDHENAETGLVGRVVVSLPHYSAVATLVANDDVVATLPRRIAEREATREGLVLLDPPYEPIRVTIEAVWLQRPDRDPALPWFVDEVAAAVRAEPGLLPS